MNIFKRLIPSCLVGNNPKAQGVNHQRVTKYETHIGQVTLTWSRLRKGIKLTTEVCLSVVESKGRMLTHEIKPSEACQQNGTRRFQIKRSIYEPPCQLDFAWNFSHAKFRTRGDAQPTSSYFFGVAVEGEVIVLEGDMPKEAYKHLRQAENQGCGWASQYKPVVREDTVNLKGRPYVTSANLGGRDREICINIEPSKYAPMTVSLGREKLVELKSLWCEDRGTKDFQSSEEVITISWRRSEWTPSLSKNRVRFRPERESSGVVLPRVLVSLTCRQFAEPRHSTVYLRLISQ